MFNAVFRFPDVEQMTAFFTDWNSRDNSYFQWNGTAKIVSDLIAERFAGKEIYDLDTELAVVFMDLMDGLSIDESKPKIRLMPAGWEDLRNKMAQAVVDCIMAFSNKK